MKKTLLTILFTLCLSISVLALKYAHVRVEWTDGTILNYTAMHSTLTTEFERPHNPNYDFLLSELGRLNPFAMHQGAEEDYNALYQEFWAVGKGEQCDWECHQVPFFIRYNFWIKPEYADSIKEFEVYQENH